MSMRPAALGDLFEVLSKPIVPTLADIVTVDEERELIAHIDGAELAPFRFQQWIGKRLTASFGSRYDFASGAFGPADPIPAWLEPLRQRAARFAGLEGDTLGQALLIRYDPGAGIGWHRDRPVYEHVVGVSLGTTATMRFRRRLDGRFERRTAVLDPRAAYHLTGEMRHEWEHSIAALDQPRWSITFRSLSERGRAAVGVHHKENRRAV